MIQKAIKFIFRPELLIDKLRWRIFRKKLARCGKNSSLGTSFRLIGPENIYIGDRLEGGRYVSLCTWRDSMETKNKPCLFIGNNVHITEYSYISCANRVTIGDGCLLGVNTYITDNSHGDNSRDCLEIPPHERKLFSKGKVNIGRNVWIGRNVCIMPNVTIGECAIIGANSVVTHDIPAFSIAVGAPARVIREEKGNN